MNELIKITYDDDIPSVSGRELHEFLEVGTPYHIWFPRMCEYGFSEGEDFTLDEQICSTNNPKNTTTTRMDHRLTIDMAKELCMIQRTQRGKQARQYFLDLERKWNTPELVISRALKMADRQILGLRQANDELAAQVEAVRPKVLFYDAVSATEDCLLIREFSKFLSQNGVNIGEKRLFEWLRRGGYLVRKQGRDHNSPTQRAMKMGLFWVKEESREDQDGRPRIDRTTLVTGKGQQYFLNKFLAQGESGEGGEEREAA